MFLESLKIDPEASKVGSLIALTSISGSLWRSGGSLGRLRGPLGRLLGDLGPLLGPDGEKVVKKSVRGPPGAPLRGPFSALFPFFSHHCSGSFSKGRSEGPRN